MSFKKVLVLQVAHDQRAWYRGRDALLWGENYRKYFAGSQSSLQININLQVLLKIKELHFEDNIIFAWTEDESSKG